MAVSLTACGGGGGGGDTSSTTPTSTPTSPNTAPAAVALSVKVNGAARTADANGNIAINPGDAVSISSSQGNGWSSSPVADALFTLRVKLIDGQSWAATILNRRTTAGTLTVTATSATGPGTSVNFVVGAGDARNGNYTVFAANGTRQTLALNFDDLSYDMTAPTATPPAAPWRRTPPRPARSAWCPPAMQVRLPTPPACAPPPTPWSAPSRLPTPMRRL